MDTCKTTLMFDIVQNVHLVLKVYCFAHSKLVLITACHVETFTHFLRGQKNEPKIVPVEKYDKYQVRLCREPEIENVA